MLTKTGSLVLAMLPLGGALAAVGTFPLPGAPAPATEAPPPAHAAPSGPYTWRCGPGPVRVSEMAITEGGYYKALPQAPRGYHEFYFARAIYSEGGRGGGFFGGRRGGDFLGDGGPAWSIDYPDADRIMTRVATRLSNLDACEWENPISLADPDLRRFPFLYSLEWGYAYLTEAEVVGLREYLLAGGLLMLDDFWGTEEWANFEREMQRVLPGRVIVDIPRDHLLFRIYYDIDGDIVQVPNRGNGRAVAMGAPGARTWERDGYEAHIRGIFDEHGRLMVVINWNTDLGDALEWAEDPYYPLHFSTFASRIFLNTIMYAMTN